MLGASTTGEPGIQAGAEKSLLFKWKRVEDAQDESRHMRRDIAEKQRLAIFLDCESRSQHVCAAAAGEPKRPPCRRWRRERRFRARRSLASPTALRPLGRCGGGRT
jgi:hypothetical protein